MDAKKWKTKIIEACEAAGTYRKYFDQVITTLSGILEKRDEAEELYKKMGANPIIKHTNKGGATNIVKNPALILWDDLNKSALSYWRDLGLTPAGLKKIDEAALKGKKQSALEKALSDLG